ncbi:MAG TPA: chemotaxis protein CheD [Bryobacteraceae bacterium]|jgi:chemotaxis protein CheD|nr:chemotaxis protein CheD [Bryobacteraceae bacterium]
MNTLVVVGVADCKVSASAGAEVTTYALGSCIGLAVYDPYVKVGGLLHYMLPDSSIMSGTERNLYKFADTGIPKLIDEVCALGASKKRLDVWAAGAANMLTTAGGFEIGKRNHQALRRILWKAGLLVQAEAIGGNQSRSVRLEIATGKFWVQEAGEERKLLQPAKKGGDKWRIAS